MERLEVLNDLEIHLDKTKLYETPPFSRWKEGKTKEQLDEILEGLIKKVETEHTPHAMYRIIKREKTNIGDYSAPEPLLNSDYLAIGIETIGEDKDGREGSSFETMVKDALKNVLLNEVLRRVVDGIAEMAKDKDLNTTRVISPGSGRVDWGVENQEFVFENLDGDEIGVRLTSTKAIYPQKSTSFVLGIGKEIEQAKDLYSCRGCERMDCDYRVEIPSK